MVNCADESILLILMVKESSRVYIDLNEEMNTYLYERSFILALLNKKNHATC